MYILYISLKLKIRLLLLNMYFLHFRNYFCSSVEVYSWLLELGDGVVDVLDGGRIVWYVSYVYKSDKSKNQISASTVADESKKRLTTKLEVNKDDIQAVLPMAKVIKLFCIYKISS